MIDIRRITEEPEVIAANNARRGRDLDIEKNQKQIKERAALIGQVEDLRRQANEVAESIPRVSDEERAPLVAKGKEIKEQVKEVEASLRTLEEGLNADLKRYPNILRDDVPDGASDAENEVMRTVGEVPAFAFPVKDHLELGEHLGIIDVERAAKVSGARFTYLIGDGARLQFALLNYAMDTLLKESFTPVLTPHLVKVETMDAMGYLAHGGEDEIYHMKHDDLVLIGTSEQSVGPMHKDETLDASQLPIRYVGYSPCYRREAGSYGKDTRGILRVHQFDKIEMFSFTDAQSSDTEHEFLLSMQERLMQGLELPYQVMKLCAGDTGTPSARTYDINTWMPAQETYRETHSTSNTTDYQTRRLKTKVKGEGKAELVHALNGTAFAIGRILIAILENNQQEDGTVRVPKILQPYMGGTEIIEPRS